MVCLCLDEMTFFFHFIRTLTGILQFGKQKHDKHWPLALQFVVWNFLLVVENDISTSVLLASIFTFMF